MKLPMIKLFVASMAAIYAPAFALFPNCPANEYCFKRQGVAKDYIVILEKVKRKGEWECSKEALSDEYKFCQWNVGTARTKVSLDENLTLETQYIFQDNSIVHRKEYDTVVINYVSRFSCHKCYKEGDEKYNKITLPILKKSIGKTFTPDIEIEVSCPRDANDTNYTENKILKINRPIVVTGECP